MFFASPDGRLDVRVEPRALISLRRLAADVHPLETGGALVGYFESNHLAVVTDVLGPPADTVHGRTSLDLGAAGLADYFKAIWPSRFYLGSWHTHPGESSPVASDTDHATMRALAANPAEKCPQPLSLILGGEPGAYALSATVYEHGEPVLLSPCTSNPSRSAP